MLKPFQINAIQQALVTAGLHYEHPTGVWDDITTQSYRQFHAVVLFQADTHLIQQPTSLESVCAELLQLAGLLNGPSRRFGTDDKDSDKDSDDDGEGDTDDLDPEGDDDDKDSDEKEEDDGEGKGKPEPIRTSAFGSVVLQEGGAVSVEQLQEQQGNSLQLNAGEITEINRQAGVEGAGAQEEPEKSAEDEAEQQEQQEEQQEAERTEPTAEELAAQKAQEEADTKPAAQAEEEADEAEEVVVAKPVAKKKKAAK